jgi:hypothetical protein
LPDRKRILLWIRRNRPDEIRDPISLSVPTGNAEGFEMMEITHLPATRLYVHLANRDLGFSACLSLPRGCGIGELRPPSPTQFAKTLRETSAEVDVGLPAVMGRPLATWADWRSALTIVQPETVIAWHRKAFRLFWTWKVRNGQPGRPGAGSGPAGT